MEAAALRRGNSQLSGWIAGCQSRRRAPLRQINGLHGASG